VRPQWALLAAKSGQERSRVVLSFDNGVFTDGTFSVLSLLFFFFCESDLLVGFFCLSFVLSLSAWLFFSVFFFLFLFFVFFCFVSFSVVACGCGFFILVSFYSGRACAFHVLDCYWGDGGGENHSLIHRISASTQLYLSASSLSTLLYLTRTFCPSLDLSFLTSLGFPFPARDPRTGALLSPPSLVLPQSSCFFLRCSLSASMISFFCSPLVHALFSLLF